MSFDVAASAYDRFMGGWSVGLSPQLADLAGIGPGQRVLDVGCGPGALTTELVLRVGLGSVTAVDPSASFVAAARERHPGLDVRQASAEALPFPDGSFDAALAQLVVHFMTDPVAGLREMARVTRPGGIIAACVWDHAGRHGPQAAFWEAARSIEPGVNDESERAGTRDGHLVELFRQAGLDGVEQTSLPVTRRFASFDAWWEPFMGSVGPTGAFVASLDPERRAELRDRCREILPDGPFELEARAWAATGVVTELSAG